MSRKQTGEALLSTVTELGRRLGIESAEDELVACFAESVSSRIGDHRLAVRLAPVDASAPVVWAATCAPKEDLATTPPEPEPDAAYRPVFTETADGCAIPLVAGGKLLGLVNLEHGEQVEPAVRDEVAALAQLLAAAVRDRRLSRDPRFLRGWLAGTVDNANALIFVVDAERHVVLFNRALSELTGYTAEEVVDREMSSWVTVDAYPDFTRRLDRAFGGRPVSGCELTLQGKDGLPVQTIFNLSRPPDLAEVVVAIGQDVTAVKVLEHQVIQAEKLASLGQLAAGVVHEINNPLTSITVYADYLIKKFRGQGCDPADVEMLEKILEGSNRILKFARDLVDYGKPSGSQRDVLSFNEVVQQSISFCEHILDGASVKLEVELAADLPPLYGFKDQLQQVIINLLTNACHSLNEGGARVTVRTWNEGGGRVAVEVVDDGCGIPTDDLPRIFEPFFTTKTPGEGTGLGLSIVKKIVDLHNGSILVESEPERGTRFCITLPTGHGPEGRE
jgi:two-component system NtrC family sensor kinase